MYFSDEQVIVTLKSASFLKIICLNGKNAVFLQNISYQNKQEANERKNRTVVEKPDWRRV